MRQQRPGSVLTIAILHLIGGGLGLVLGICGGVILLMQSSLMKSPLVNPQDLGIRLQKHLEQQVPYNATIQYVSLFIDLILSIMLLTAGMGLLSMRNWARSLSFVYAGLSILMKLFAIVFFLFITWPIMSAFLDAESRVVPAGPAGAAIRTQITVVKASPIATVILTAVLAVYPIVVLFVLLNPSVRRAFAEQPGADRDDDNDDRYEDDRPRKRTSRRDDEDDDDDRWRERGSDRIRS